MARGALGSDIARVLPCPQHPDMNRTTPVFPHSRHDRLRAALLDTVDLLARRRAAEINAGFIEDYVALHWLEWHGGTLRLTVTGRNVCSQLSGKSL